MIFLKVSWLRSRLGRRVFIGVAATVAVTGRAQEVSVESVGARGGAAPGNGYHFHQAEGFVNLDLPWMWDLGRQWRLQSRLDVSAGWLGDSGGNAAISTVGPSLIIDSERSMFSLEVGISPTWLTQYHFGTKDFGMHLQFTSHVGFNLDLSSRIRIGYRFQHMSNGGLIKPNPGLNLHTMAVSYLF